MLVKATAGANKEIAVNALARVDDDAARAKLSELAREKAADATARKAAYRALRRQQRLHAQHDRREHPDNALPSWSGRVGETAAARPEVTK